VLLAQGCVCGHLLDAARRRERPIRYEEASLDGDRLLLRYTALVTDDVGQPLGHDERRVAIALSGLRQSPPIDLLPVEHLAHDAPLAGQRVDLDGARDGPLALEIHTDASGRHTAVVLHDARNGRYPPVYSSGLARARTAAWVYPVLPLAAAIDAVTNPLLLLLAPAVILPGD
jgi:hypothetical protein